MADLTFNTTAGATVERELLIAYLNTASGSSSTTPVWSPLGCRVEDSSAEYDWSEESVTDILGQTRTSLKKPVITQSFDPYKLDGGDAAIVKLWNMGIKDHNYAGLSNLDMLIVHCYAGTANTAMFAERYSACAVRPTGLGGEGGGDVEMPLDVTYGGVRTTGTAAIASGVVTFTADSSSGGSGGSGD